MIEPLFNTNRILIIVSSQIIKFKNGITARGVNPKK